MRILSAEQIWHQIPVNVDHLSGKEGELQNVHHCSVEISSYCSDATELGVVRQYHASSAEKRVANRGNTATSSSSETWGFLAKSIERAMN